MNTIYTMGYGRTTKSEFISRTWEVKKETNKSLILVDIRRKGSGSRNGQWCYQGLDGLEGLWRTVGWLDILSEPRLANGFGNTKEGLEVYRHCLEEGLLYAPDSKVRKAVDIIRFKTDPRYHEDMVVVLLCAERKPFKANGKTPNCHRVVLAEELVRELGDEWEVRHL